MKIERHSLASEKSAASYWNMLSDRNASTWVLREPIWIKRHLCLIFFSSRVISSSVNFFFYFFIFIQFWRATLFFILLFFFLSSSRYVWLNASILICDIWIAQGRMKSVGKGRCANWKKKKRDWIFFFFVVYS